MLCDAGRTKVTVTSCEKELNAILPILVTLAGIVISFREKHPKKAASPMLVTSALTVAVRLELAEHVNVAVQLEPSAVQFHVGVFAAIQVTVQTFFKPLSAPFPSFAKLV